jgi:hypothetical protein
MNTERHWHRATSCLVLFKARETDEVGRNLKDYEKIKLMVTKDVTAL